MTALDFLPFMSGSIDRLKPYFVYPSIGRYHVHPLPYLLGNAPTAVSTSQVRRFELML